MSIYWPGIVAALVLLGNMVPAIANSSMEDAGCVINSRRHVQALLSRGAHVDVTDGEGKTLLFHAVECGNEQGVRALIAEGADIDIKDDLGMPVLAWTLGRKMDRNDRRMFQLLVSLGADVNTAGADGDPLLHDAVGDAVRALIDAGADVNALGDDGKTPLHLAATLPNPFKARILIAAGAEVNATDEDGETPLHSAVRGRKTGVGTVEVLLAAGANPSTMNSKGCSPVDEARRVVRRSGDERAQHILAALVAKGGRPRCS